MNRAAPARSFARIRRSLSTQLLMLTILFVLLAEAVVMIPSVAKQRADWLYARIEAAYLVGLALEAPDQEMIDPTVARQLFATANILGVTVTRQGARVPVYSPDIGAYKDRPMHYVNLHGAGPVQLTLDAWGTMFSRGDRLLRVIGWPKFGGEEVGMLVSQRALRRDLHTYARNILGLSLIISTLTAALVYWSLDCLIVRPVRRLTGQMAAFNANPEDERNIIEPTRREDEIGAAQESLRALERRVHELLSQRRRLAALGAGVSKLSHDLRNILASAQLMSDRLAGSDDPRVKKLSPRLIQALDRAIALSRDTLSYARMEPAMLSKSRFPLKGLVDEVFDDTAVMHARFVNEVPEDLEIVADRNQLYRALFNLVRNAAEALAPADEGGGAPAPNGGRVFIRARKEGANVEVEVADNGPGLPEEARAHLFEPFMGSRKPGGSGLGAAIAHEIASAHGGALVIAKSDDHGTVFALTLPQA
ncbi:sensor histidine kinase [Amphiplicatus metriothermophilus]|uniref:histidine kinase n=1 Tax=Amphiplicatus metriothermophilus TaxID=1519374 RepID=A0A239PIH5_9PROT|nr:HAMP domain-containing sensor histidine kinase [Amphiplicatus metriothermophilus]MBB5518054.1 signal transduction histidine kinase [Amphiplicatus metriothermophilus]SNT67612.1 signal transduction histidine kinase /histidine kinase [Amphiplicatus metriothermophilus]